MTSRGERFFCNNLTAFHKSFPHNTQAWSAFLVFHVWQKCPIQPIKRITYTKFNPKAGNFFKLKSVGNYQHPDGFLNFKNYLWRHLSTLEVKRWSLDHNVFSHQQQVTVADFVMCYSIELTSAITKTDTKVLLKNYPFLMEWRSALMNANPKIAAWVDGLWAVFVKQDDTDANQPVTSPDKCAIL